MISLKIKKYRPYAKVTMVVNNSVEIDLGMLGWEELNTLYLSLSEAEEQVSNVIDGFAE